MVYVRTSYSWGKQNIAFLVAKNQKLDDTLNKPNKYQENTFQKPRDERNGKQTKHNLAFSFTQIFNSIQLKRIVGSLLDLIARLIKAKPRFSICKCCKIAFKKRIVDIFQLSYYSSAFFQTIVVQILIFTLPN